MQVEDNEDNSYIEPSYDEADQSEEESYEPTLFVPTGKAVNQITQQNDEVNVGRPADSDDDGVDVYEATHD